MKWLIPWKRWLRKHRAERQTAVYERKRAALMKQIARRKNARDEWKPKLGELCQATTAALNAERWLEG